MRALVLSGGGAKGAYQAGVLKHWLLARQYSIYAGVSVGAINSAFLAMFPPTDLARAGDKLVEMWGELETKKVHKRWFPFGKLHALWEKSVYDSRPLETMMRSRLSRAKILASGNKLFVGAVSLDTGEYRLFDNDFPDTAGAVLASAAFPAMLSPIKLDGEWWIDGGVRNVTPLKSAIDAGATTIDVIMTEPTDFELSFGDKANTLKVAGNSLNIMIHEIMENDIHLAQTINQLVAAKQDPKKRLIAINVMRPLESLTDDSLDFSPDKIDGMIRTGLAQAQQATWTQ